MLTVLESAVPFEVRERQEQSVISRDGRNQPNAMKKQNKTVLE